MHSFYTFKMGISPKIGTFTASRLSNNPLVSCSLRNFDFLLLQTEHVDKSLIFLYFVFATSGFLLCVYFPHFKQ